MTNLIPLPNLGIAYEFAGIQYQLAREFGSQFGALVDERFRENGLTTWFALIQERRAKANKPTYEDPKDPRFLLSEALFWDSELRLVVPEVDAGWDPYGKKLAKTLNAWSHQKYEPTPEIFLSLLVEMESAAQPLNLTPLLELLDDLIERTKQIKNGVWVPEGPAATVSADADQYATQVVRKVEDVKQRPPVGHEWIGEPGERVVELSRATRDVYEKGVSIRAELGNSADEKITSWLRYYPLGGRLRIDTDGAVLGFKQGIGYLIGWLGEEPGVKQEEARGFYLPHEYEFVPTDIRDVKTGELLSRIAKEPIDWILDELALKVPQNAILNMTIYGDLVYETEKGTELKIATVHKDIWFRGHLGEVGNSNFGELEND
jgi:hypothetical protein